MQNGFAVGAIAPRLGVKKVAFAVLMPPEHCL
jgi:hypothetical protein